MDKVDKAFKDFRNEEIEANLDRLKAAKHAESMARDKSIHDPNWIRARIEVADFIYKATMTDIDDRRRIYVGND